MSFTGTAPSSLIAPVADAALEHSLRDILARRGELIGHVGELEPLAIRLGLIQQTLQPQLQAPKLLLFAADHGLAVDGVCGSGQPETAQLVDKLLKGCFPVSAFAHVQGLALTVVDCGVADRLPPHPRLLARKIAHGSRNLRVAAAMSAAQVRSAIRAGMEIADNLTGNVLACAGIGLGSHESAALLLSALTGTPVRDLALFGGRAESESEALLMSVLQTAQQRHAGLSDALDVLAACGGFEMAMMVGAMLVAASRRSLLMVDGLPACAALMVAARISPEVLGYAVFCRSHGHPGLTRALKLFHSVAVLEIGLDCLDGTGAALAFPIARSAASLLADLTDDAEPLPPESDSPPALPPWPAA